VDERPQGLQLPVELRWAQAVDPVGFRRIGEHYISLRIKNPQAESEGLLGLLKEGVLLAQRLVRFGRLTLRGPLRGEVGQDQAPQEHPVEVETADRQQDRNRRATRSGQVHFAA
jgi:hypothetical protein